MFPDNYIDGKEFLSLTESEVKAMIPPTYWIGKKEHSLLTISKVTVLNPYKLCYLISQQLHRKVF